jgi:AraC-like DNA-binding protein
VKSKVYEISKLSINDHKNPFGTMIADKVTISKSVELHWHNYYEIEYILDGTAKEILNGELMKIEPGLFHVLAPSDFHEHIIDSPLTLVRIGFEISSIDYNVFNNASGILAGKVLRFSGEEKELFDNLFASVSSEIQLYKNTSVYPKIIKKLLEAIIITANEYNNAKFTDKKSENQKEINTALAYIHTNFRQHITLSEVAESVHFSASYFSRYFHDNMKMTFVQYIKNLRMQYATNLIKNTNADIIDICYESGFSSPSSFSNEFKKIHNISPTQYRMREKEIKKCEK